MKSRSWIPTRCALSLTVHGWLILVCWLDDPWSRLIRRLRTNESYDKLSAEFFAMHSNTEAISTVLNINCNVLQSERCKLKWQQPKYDSVSKTELNVHIRNIFHGELSNECSYIQFHYTVENLSLSLQRHYSPGWVSASLKSFLHPSRFRATTVQFLHPSFAALSFTPSSQRNLGLPLGRFPPGSLRRILLDRSSSWRMTCPAHLNLLSLQNFTISFSPYNW
jgi:hypothetical protein